MTLTQQMRIELVHIRAGFRTDVALPRIGFAMTTLVEEVERLIGKFNAAISAHQIPFLRTRPENDCVVVGAGRCNRTVRGSRRNWFGRHDHRVRTNP